MKPTLAPYMLQALDEEDVAVSPQHFEILISAFGLDDVLSGIDAVPGNRRALDKAVRVGGYPPFVAPLLARLVTGRGAAYRTGLRWLPLVARSVGNLLRCLSAKCRRGAVAADSGDSADQVAIRQSNDRENERGPLDCAPVRRFPPLRILARQPMPTVSMPKNWSIERSRGGPTGP